MHHRVDKRGWKKYLKAMSFRICLMGVGFCVTALCVAAVTPEDAVSNRSASNAQISNSANAATANTFNTTAFNAPKTTPRRSYRTISNEVSQTGLAQNETWGDNNESDVDFTKPQSAVRRYPLASDDVSSLSNTEMTPTSSDVGSDVRMAALTPKPGYILPPAPTLKTPSERITRPVDYNQVRGRIHRLMKQKRMVGLSIAIVENGQLTHAEGFGETLNGSGDRVTEDTIFRWASVSKGVAAATLLSLADEGALSLDNPVSGFDTSLKLPRSRHDITVEDLLSHRVGIVRNAYDRRIEEGRDPQDVRASIQHLRHVCAPGTCHSYQNVIYDSASEIAEGLTGMPYKSVVSERLFKPLDMTTATTTYEGLIRSKSWAKPHTRVGRPIRRVKPNYYRVPAAAGVNSSIVDLSKWMLAQMDDDMLAVSASARAEMQTPRVNTPRESRLLRRKYYGMKNAKYGLGWRIYDYGGHKVIGHRGGVEGYRALVLFDPEIQTGVAMMWNSSHSDPIGLQLEIMDQVYGNRTRDWMRLNRG